jgi:hypothetical protein
VGPLPPWRQFETLDGAVPGAAPGFVRAVGATRVIARRGSAVAADLERAGHAPVAGDGRFVVLAPPGPAPRAFLAPRARMATAEDAVAAAREGRALEPEVLVEAEPAGAREAGDADGRIDLVEDGGRSYAVRVSVDRPTWLVLRAPYYRRWAARIDGAAAVVRPAGGFLLGVRVEAGDHDVVLAYREPGFATGLVVALVASVALAVAARRRATVEKAGRVT